MRELMEALLVDGLSVQLDVLRIDSLEIDGEVFPASALDNRELRRLIENLMVWRHGRDGFEVLNA
ncbi:MAG TPA: hypothetical protein VNJ03_15890 [Vicinamibacterales bacterium]|nr:hypothetical protein [Vicinamibacterales bacterium]